MHMVVPLPGVDGVVSALGIYKVAFQAGVDEVGTLTGADDIQAPKAAYQVASGHSSDDVLAVSPDEVVVPRRSDDRCFVAVAGRAESVSR